MMRCSAAALSVVVVILNLDAVIVRCVLTLSCSISMPCAVLPDPTQSQACPSQIGFSTGFTQLARFSTDRR